MVKKIEGTEEAGKSMEVPKIKSKINLWMISTAVLALIVVVMLVRAGITGSAIGALGSEQAGTKVTNLINSYFIKDGSATIDSVVEESGLYKVTLNYNNNKIPVYLTKDGTSLILPNGIVSVAELEATAQNAEQETTEQPVEIPIGNSPIIGNPDVKLTIVEFSDFSCPFCGAASGQTKDMVDYMKSKYPNWEPAVPGIIKDYVNTGKAKLVYKYSMGHSGGHPATLVGFCLNDQNLFWEFHDKAFANQADVENLDKMKALAQSLGADMTKLNACLDSKKYDSKLNEDEALGQSIGIGGTPAIYANGIKVASGAESYSDVKKAIEAILAQMEQ